MCALLLRSVFALLADDRLSFSKWERCGHSLVCGPCLSQVLFSVDRDGYPGSAHLTDTRYKNKRNEDRKVFKFLEG